MNENKPKCFPEYATIKGGTTTRNMGFPYMAFFSCEIIKQYYNFSQNLPEDEFPISFNGDVTTILETTCFTEEEQK